MFNIKYKNCYKNHDEEKNVFVFSPFDKNNEIVIKNKSDEYEMVISTKNKIQINNRIIENEKKKFLLRTNEKIKIIFLDLRNYDKNKFKLYYIKKNNIEQKNIEQKNIEVNKDIISNKGEINYSLNNIITILTPDCMIYISKILQEKFINLGWECRIINNSEFEYYLYKINNEPNHYLLLYCLFLIDTSKLIKNKYIIYQLEQNINNKISFHYNFLINNNKLEYIIKNSKIFIDYNKQNIDVFKNEIKISPLLMQIPFKLNNYYLQNEISNKKYDLIFIGCINDRRNNILKKLKFKYNIYIPDSPIYENELYELFKSSKILLNIHFYDNAILERPRLNEAIYSGIRIISEKPNDMDIHICDIYKNLVNFVEIINDGNLTELENTIDKLLSNNNYITNFNYNELYNLEKYFNNSFSSIFTNNLFLNKSEIAVISANYGNYDKEIISLENIDNWDYFDWYYFTDITEIKSQYWKIINYDYTNNHNIKINYFNNFNMMKAKFYKVKMLDIDLLSKYKYILWTDGSLYIDNKNMIIDLLNIIQKNHEYNFFNYEHYFRNNIKDESEISMTIDKYKDQDIIGQVNKYINNGYIDNFLYECGIFIVKNNLIAKKSLDDWWNEIINNSYQDQISFPYVIWKNNIKPFILNDSNFKKMSLDGSVWKNKLFGYIRNHK
jgi:hypothetical protein